MASKLSTAPTIIARGVFDSVATFAQLEERISCLGEENTKILGDAFEIFVEALLATQSKFMAEEVFLVGQVPQAIREEMNLPNDSKGIDGIFRTLTGTLVPYQVKFRSNRPQLTFTEVSPFLGLTERATDRIIFTNSNDIAVTAANRDAMRSVRGGDFDELTQQDFESIECWLKEKPISIPKPEPRDYQIEALKSIRETLETNDRATAVMACGTGKTLLALWVTESIKPKTVLVLVPSITLVQQTLEEWSRNNSWGNKITYICVCSDSRVADGIQEDSIQLKASDVDFPVDTNPHIVRKFLERKTDQIKVVFSTYQSSDVVIEASKGLEPYDIAIFDEAHKTTGPQGGLFALCLSETNIRISKRLFLTATPRHYDIRHKDDNDDFKTASMDDAEIYGPRAYTLTFGEAARRGIICDYKVVISVVDGNEISQFSLDHGITLVEGDTIGARWVANQIAIERAIKKTGAKRAITFHSRISSAKEFSSDTSRGIKQFLPDFNSFHVSGSQNSSERKQIIRAFREAPKAIITNARCLTEGIDIPAVDMVAFVDPRQSRVDIAQATGRAMRKPRGSDKTTGYVVIPLFVERSGDQSVEEALEASDFAEVNSVLNAMREQDEDLVQIIREMKEAKGRGDVFNPTALAEPIEVLGPSIDRSVLQANIYAEIVDSIGVSWDEWYGRLVAFKEREGHCFVRIGKIIDGFNLGGWVSTQRGKWESLSADRIQRLEDIGFVWDVFKERWEKVFSHLKKFKDQKGHCRVFQGEVFDGFKLGNWVSTWRAYRDKLSDDRIQRLDDIGFAWDKKHLTLTELITNGIASEDGETLGVICARIRSRKKEDIEHVLNEMVKAGIATVIETYNRFNKRVTKRYRISADQGKKLTKTDFIYDKVLPPTDASHNALRSKIANLIASEDGETFGGICDRIRSRKKEDIEHVLNEMVAADIAYVIETYNRFNKKVTKRYRMSDYQVKQLTQTGFIWDADVSPTELSPTELSLTELSTIVASLTDVSPRSLRSKIANMIASEDGETFGGICDRIRSRKKEDIEHVLNEMVAADIITVIETYNRFNKKITKRYRMVG